MSIADTYQFGAPSTLVVNSLSTETIGVQVVASLNKLSVNPTGLAASYAIVAPGVQPAGGDWHAAAWSTVSLNAAILYYLRIPATDIAAGDWDVYVKITDGALIPVSYIARIESR